MSNRLTALACALAFALCAAADARADVRIKQKMTVGGHTMESDVAIKGQRQRTETEMAPGMKTVQIMQCDLKRVLQVSDATRKYTVTPSAGDATRRPAKRRRRPTLKSRPPRRSSHIHDDVATKQASANRCSFHGAPHQDLDAHGA